jgi:uncharacterized membrane protein
MVGGLLLLATGIGLILAVDAWSISSGFVLFGIVAIAISGTTESLFFSRQAAVLQSLLGAPGSSSEIVGRLTRLLRVAVALDAMFLLVVWAMVFKPGA